MPSRESRQRVFEALVVDEAHPDADWIDYIQQQSRADDGRRVTEGSA